MAILTWTEIVSMCGVLVSLAAFFHQLHRNKILKSQQDEWKKALISRSQASYNYFHTAALICGEIRSNNEDINFVLARVDRITGIADSARTDIISYCRSHLDGYTPFYEHPAKPGYQEPMDTSV